ncbi:MAG: NAD-dependent epimerase/dehydratase family protein, partial [Flavobacteriales bacterium]
MDTKVLIIGSQGQIGTELTAYLTARYGAANVIESDIQQKNPSPCTFVALDATDKNAVYELVKKENIDTVYLLAAMLS